MWRAVVSGLAGSILAFAPSAFAADAEARARAFESAFAPAIRVAGAPPERWTLAQRMARWNVPGVSVAVIEDGKLAWARSYGVRQAGTGERIDSNTVFSVGSLSKVATAAVILKLVEQQRLHLDRGVNDYLTRWRLPGSLFKHDAIDPVTLRGILSHSAGLSVSGFPDFQPGEPLPTVVDTLEGRAPAKTAPVRVSYVPGSGFSYSGGGTTVAQLIVEEVTGMPFAQAARELLFAPLRMTRSTFENPLPPAHGNMAKAHDDNGNPAALPRGWQTMPEMAASGLWTSATDYARLVIALIDSYRGASNSFLSSEMARDMMTEVGRSPYGLGPQLAGSGYARHFFHGGANDSYKAWMEGCLTTGDGMVIVTNGAGGDELNAEIRRAIARVEGWEIPYIATLDVPKVAIAEERLRRFAGLYEQVVPANLSNRRAGSGHTARRWWWGLHHAYSVTLKDGSLYMSGAAEQAGERLIPVDPSHFVVADDPAITLEFVTGYDGRITGFLAHDAGYAFEGRKIHP